MVYTHLRDVSLLYLCKEPFCCCCSPSKKCQGVSARTYKVRRKIVITQRRGETLQHIMNWQLRQQIMKNFWNHDQRNDWHFQKQFTYYQSNVCWKKLNWDKFLSQGLILEKLIYHLCLFRLRHFATQCLKNLHSKQPENGQISAKNRQLFWPLTLDD